MMSQATQYFRSFITLIVALCGHFFLAAAVDAAAVRGSISFEGRIPSSSKAEVSSHCQQKTHPSAVKIGADQGLADVAVIVKKRAHAATKSEDEIPVVLTARDCVLEPRIHVMKPGQKLVISKKDLTPIRFTLKDEMGQVRTLNFPKGVTQKSIRIRKPGRYLLRAPQHPTYAATVIVDRYIDSAVSDGNGLFELKNLPIGMYHVEFFHELLGRQERLLSVSEKNQNELKVTYAR